jgi:hypothetical protein
MLMRKVIIPNEIIGVLPIKSEIAPENNWMIANGNMKAGMVINKSPGRTLNSPDSTPNKTNITFPVIGPNANNTYITPSKIMALVFSLFSLLSLNPFYHSLLLLI